MSKSNAPAVPSVVKWPCVQPCHKVDVLRCDVMWRGREDSNKYDDISKQQGKTG